jgi:coenzyme F420-0:L-glutamate ligase / coenzyme F420-1:gamma-L-glutamate ligase
VTDVVAVHDPGERSRVADAVLRDLPEWFGFEDWTRATIDEAAGLPTFAALPDRGFVSLKQHTAGAAEIYVMGVRRALHGRGIGRALVAAAEAWCREHGVSFLLVKTLGPSHPDSGYAATRRFYQAVGFVPLQELTGLWEEGQPTLLLVKRVEPGFVVMPVRGLPELREDDDLAALIAERAELVDGDVVVVAQKAVSKVEGRVVALDGIEASERAHEIADGETDPRRIEVILREAAEVVRVRPPLVIARTHHGFVCGSAGVDASNAPGLDTLVLLPVDPDASAAALRGALRARTGADVGVIVTDSFGRPWRGGTTDVAIGASGVEVVRDLAGARDPVGYELHATRIAIADEIAGAAQLVFGKLDRVPVAVVRGLAVAGDGSASELVIPPDRDLFR